MQKGNNKQIFVFLNLFANEKCFYWEKSARVCAPANVNALSNEFEVLPKKLSLDKIPESYSEIMLFVFDFIRTISIVQCYLFATCTWIQSKSEPEELKVKATTMIEAWKRERNLDSLWVISLSTILNWAIHTASTQHKNVKEKRCDYIFLLRLSSIKLRTKKQHNKNYQRI